jgi:dipeptidyl aminopeptidase/acylaminoacyl peptidase
MNLKKLSIGAIFIILLLGAAVLPALFTGNPRAPLIGPDLADLAYEEIQFDNGDLRLAGMVFVPEGEGPFPVAVIIHGSGTSRRNNAWYLSVTRHLQDNGVAVLLPDKRGSAKSEGSWVGADFHDLAGDTLAAVSFVRAQERFADSPVGLVGMSQGGWIAPVAAAEDGGIDFVVSMSGATVATDRQLLHEEIHNISEFTWPFIARLLAPMSSRQILNMDHVRAYADFDPMPYWRRVGVPKFIAFGGDDSNVPVEESLEALRQSGIDGLIKVYPDGGHAIADPETHTVQVEFLDDLVEFIGRS